MFGLMLLKGQGEESINMIGIVFALLASVSYAVYVFSNRKKDSINLDARSQSFLLCLGSAGVFLLTSLYQQQFTFPVTFQAWIYILGISIIATALPIQLMLVGMKQTSAVRASILTVFEPLVTFLVGIVLLNEMVSTRQILGVIVVLTSVTLYQLKGALKSHSIETRAKQPSCNNLQEI
jgi:drug/metabolite transporter (DMT)-like permease